MRDGVDGDLLHGRRREGRDRELADVRLPLDDVDLFAVQFLDDGADAAAAHADARADGIHLGIAGTDRHLRADAGLAGDRDDLDHAVVDLRGLLGEQGAHERFIGARKLHDRVVRRLVDHLHPAAVHVALGAVARLVVLHPALVLLHADVADHGAELVIHLQAVRLHAVATLEDRLAAGVEDRAKHVLVRRARDTRPDDLPDARGVALLQNVALGIVHALREGLLGRERRDAAQNARVEGRLHRVADPGVRIHAARFGERNVGRAFHGIVHDAALPGPDFERQGVHLHANVAGSVEALARRGLDRVRDDAKQRLAADAAFALESLENGIEVDGHGEGLSVGRWPDGKKRRTGAANRLRNGNGWAVYGKPGRASTPV